MSMANKLLAEAIGTFTLVSAVCGAALISAAAPGVGSGILGVSLAVGLSVVAMAYAVGPVSGGHFNPAVTVGLFAAGRIPASQILPYVVAQVVGGAIAAFFFAWVLSTKGAPLPAGFASNGYGVDHSPAGFSMGAALLVEIVQTALFIFVICRVTRSVGGAGVMAPLAIGLTLTLMHIMSIPVANTSLNPARSTATALVEGGWALQQLWLFWVAPIVGGAIGGLIDKQLGDPR